MSFSLLFKTISTKIKYSDKKGKEMNKGNKILLIISLMPNCFSSSILAMETEMQTKNFYHIQNVTGITGTIEKGSEVLNELRRYCFFNNAPGTGTKNNPKKLDIEDNPNVFNTTKNFQLNLFEKIKTICILTSDNQKFKLSILSTLFNKSKTLEKMLTYKMKERADVIKGIPLVLGQINSTKFNLVVESVNNIANLPQYFADKDINQIHSLFSATSFFDIKEIMPDIILRLSNFIRLPDDFNTWLESGRGILLEKFDIYGSKIKNKLFNVALQLYIKMGYIEIQKNIHTTTFKGHGLVVNLVSFSTDGRMLASVSWDNTIKLWDLKTNKEITTIECHNDWVWSVVFSLDETILASGSSDKTIKLWDVKTGKVIKIFTGHEDWVYSVVFSTDGKILASGSWDNTIKLWDLKTNKEITTLEGNKEKIKLIVFSPNGVVLALGAWDKTIKLWNFETRKVIITLEGHRGTVFSVSFSPDGRMLASGSSDKTVKLWDLKTHTVITTFEGHKDAVNSVSFSPDGRMLASGSSDKTIKLWNLKTRKVIITLEGHRGMVFSVTFSPDGRMLASGSSDNKVKLWKLYNEKEIEELKDETSTVCLLLLQSILYAYEHEDRRINFLGFPKLSEVFKSLQSNEKELINRLLADIASKRKRKSE